MGFYFTSLSARDKKSMNKYIAAVALERDETVKIDILTSIVLQIYFWWDERIYSTWKRLMFKMNRCSRFIEIELMTSWLLGRLMDFSSWDKDGLFSARFKNCMTISQLSFQGRRMNQKKILKDLIPLGLQIWFWVNWKNYLDPLKFSRGIFVVFLQFMKRNNLMTFGLLT